MKRKDLPEIVQGMDPLPANIKRVRTKKRTSLWDAFFAELSPGDSFVIEALEVNTVKQHADKHGFEFRHAKTEDGSVLAQVHALDASDVGVEVPAPVAAE